MTIGARIRELRLERGISQAELAAELCRLSGRDTVTREVVSRWESGRREPRPYSLRYLAAALHVDVVALNNRLPDADTVSPASPEDVPPQVEHDIQPWQLMDALTRSNISAATVEQMRKAVFASAARYPSTPPCSLLPVVFGQLGRLQTALLKSQSLRTLRECVQLAGILAGLAGNLHLDIGDPAAADNYFEIGQAAGHEAEDDMLTAWVLTTRSIGPFYSGRFDEAIALLENASRLIARTHNERRASWINAMAARAYAARGDSAHALALLDQATAQLANADPPNGIDFFDQARLNGVAGNSYLQLHNAMESETMLRAAIDGRSPTDAKGRALLVFDLAGCRIIQGEIEEASALATEALDLVSDAVVRPIAIRARILQNELSPWHKLRPVAEYAERVHDLSGSIPEQRG